MRRETWASARKVFVHVTGRRHTVVPAERERRRQALVRQAEPQYRRDRLLSSGSSRGHGLHRRTFLLAIPPGSTRPAAAARAGHSPPVTSPPPRRPLTRYGRDPGPEWKIAEQAAGEAGNVAREASRRSRSAWCPPTFSARTSDGASAGSRKTRTRDSTCANSPRAAWATAACRWTWANWWSSASYFTSECPLGGGGLGYSSPGSVSSPDPEPGSGSRHHRPPSPPRPVTCLVCLPPHRSQPVRAARRVRRRRA